jgi:hypothetical protein
MVNYKYNKNRYVKNKNYCRKNILKPTRNLIINNNPINKIINYVCINHNNDIQLCNMYGCAGIHYINFNYLQNQNNKSLKTCQSRSLVDFIRASDSQTKVKFLNNCNNCEYIT